ncbi:MULTISPECIES: hypothetical protein [unclassified Streptomyces]|uniref:hypothetical protein n=1 Tax=unclassified Streptomyces TaxID=2593676 RepID=UPI000F6E323C|nr:MULTISPECIES: hypothetical protein [unclassified Streptomyces]AZM62513.1 hypothetical protein DLM49_25930 [Streptomyces sp. WAC 01438]RSM92514.1 hypothetical protein DMA10_24430 [Streptomyces sp. WAC 01420]
MKSWRSRIAVALGTAALALPLAAGSASAVEVDQWGYHKIAGWRDKLACVDDGQYALQHGYQNYYCAYENGFWVLWALPVPDAPPTRP